MEGIKEKSILLVDDEMLIAMGTKLKLEKYGYKLLLACCGEQALEFLQNHKDIGLVLMDIDLGSGSSGIDLSRKIIKLWNIPIVFVSSHTEPEFVSLTEDVTSYGYIVKSSSATAYDASIKMAYKLYIEKIRTETLNTYLKVALENASEPIFISDINAAVIFCNKAYLKITGMTESVNYINEIAEYAKFTQVFSATGQPLPPDDWASTRGLKGEYQENAVFYVYNAKIDMILVNYYTYAPIYDDQQRVIGSYVKIGPPVESPAPSVLEIIRGKLSLKLST